MMSSLVDRIYGSLIGLVFADAVGACFEGVSREELRSTFDNKETAFHFALNQHDLRYTDDGQMALSIAEYLAGNSTIDGRALMSRFCQVYEPWRGYGRGTRVLIEAFRDNADYEFLVEHLFPGGSLGNGAAMRSAPVGLRFLGDIQKVWSEAKSSALPTHRHEIGIEGAQIMAVATAVAASNASIDSAILSEYLLSLCSTVVFQNRIQKLSAVKTDSDIEQFGNGIEAHESVVTAMGCFSLYPYDYRAAVSTALWQAGDTDTICAMTGALVGAHVGAGFVEELPLERLEEGEPFREYVMELAERVAKSRD